MPNYARPNYERVARAYAKAAFDVATAENRVAEWDHMLQTMTGVVQGQEIAEGLRNPHIPRAEWANIMGNIFEAQPVSQAEKDFIRRVAGQGMLAHLPAVCQGFRTLDQQARGVTELYITTAAELSEARLEEWKDYVRTAFNVTVGKTRVVQDKGLIAGLVMQFGDTVVDKCARTRVEKIEASLRGA